MARIAIDARIINSSTGTYVLNLIKELEKLDKDNEYIVIVPTKDKEYYVPTNPNFSIVTADFPLYSFSEQLGFAKFLKKLSVDLVHFSMPQQPLLYRGKRVTTFHDLTLLQTVNTDKKLFVYKTKQSIGKVAFKKIAHISDAIITPTKYVEKEIISTFDVPSGKVHQIYEAGTTVSPSKLAKVNIPFKKYVLYVGKQSDYKNIKRLGDAHQLLLSRYPNLGLVLVGAKNKATEVNEAYFVGRNYKNIIFTGRVTDEERDWLYSHAQAYIFPSLMEGFGLPGLEAMGYGTPVVSSNATCLPEVYGQAAHYFNPLDTSDMAEAIDQALSNDKLRTRLAKAGYKQIKKYSWKKQAQETYAVYRKVLGL